MTLLTSPLAAGAQGNNPPSQSPTTTPTGSTGIRGSLSKALTGSSLMSSTKSVSSAKSLWTVATAKSALSKWTTAVLGEAPVPIEEEDDDEFAHGERISRKEQKKIEKQKKRIKDPNTEKLIRELTHQALGPPIKDESFSGRVKEHLRIDELYRKIVAQRIRVANEKPQYPDLKKLVTSMSFELLMGSIILANALCIGWDTFYKEGEPRPAILGASEHIF